MKFVPIPEPEGEPEKVPEPDEKVEIINETETSEIKTGESKIELKSSKIPNTRPDTSLDICNNFYVADAIIEAHLLPQQKIVKFLI